MPSSEKELDSMECDFSDVLEVLGELPDATLWPLGVDLRDFGGLGVTQPHPIYGTFLSPWQNLPLTLQFSACFDELDMKSGGNA